MPSQEGKLTVKPVPSGFRMVTPYLVAEDGNALLDFVKEVFSAEEMLRIDTPTGGVHGELRIGDSVMMMGGGTREKKFSGTLQPNALHVYVEDADTITEKAVAAGATLIDGVRDQEYGDVRPPLGTQPGITGISRRRRARATCRRACTM